MGSARLRPGYAHDIIPPMKLSWLGNFERLKTAPGLWRKLFVAASVLLAMSLILGIGSWYQLNILRTQLNTVKSEMENLKAERVQTLSSYADIREQVNVRLGIGQDAQFFFTPDIPEISAIVQETTGGYSDRYLWRDYGRLYQWTMKNIRYSLDSRTPILPESADEPLSWRGDFWRLPIETIRDETGDCEDTALLLASMLLNYNERRYPAWIIGLKTTGPDPKAHVAVAIPSTNIQLTIFDISGHYYTPFLGLGGFGSQYVPMALDHWLAHLDDDMPDAQVYMVFSENFYKEFSGNEEFIEWASKQLR